MILLDNRKFLLRLRSLTFPLHNAQLNHHKQLTEIAWQRYHRLQVSWAT